MRFLPWPAFFALTGAVLTASGGELNARDFGATGDGKTDDTGAIVAVLAAARRRDSAASVFFPAGTYRYHQMITVDGLAVRGAGLDRTIFEAMAPERSAWILTGRSPALSDLAIRDAHPGAKRDTRADAVGLQLYLARDFDVTRVAIGPVNSAGILVRESGGTAARAAALHDCVVRSTLADGIHLTAASQYVAVTNNLVEGTGDDLIAVVSYRRDRARCGFISIVGNHVGPQSHGRGISVVGGSDVLIEANTIHATTGAGIYLASESGYDTFGDDRITIRSNTLAETASETALGHGAIHLVGRAKPAAGSAPLGITDVVIAGNKIDGTGRTGLFVGPYSTRISIVGNAINHAVGSGIRIGPDVADISLGATAPDQPANVVAGCGEYGVQVDPARCAGRLLIHDVLFQAINGRNQATTDVINLAAHGTFAATIITDNRLELPAGRRIERFVESQTPLTEVARNLANVPIGNAYALAAVPAAGGIMPANLAQSRRP